MDKVDFFKLYNPQRGGALGDDGSLYFKAYGSRQRGHGFGGIFGAIGRRLLPFLGKHVLPHARTAIGQIASDLIDNKRNWKDSIKQHGLDALKGVGKSIFTQSGSGVRRRRTAQKGKGFKKRRNLIKKVGWFRRGRKKQKGGGKRKKGRRRRRVKTNKKQKGGKVGRKTKRRKKRTKKIPRSIFD